MALNSYKKGAAFEVELAHFLSSKFGVEVKRTGTQESHKTHKGDVNAPIYAHSILSDFCWEAKNRESWAILDWYKKVQEENEGTPRIPVVVAKKNREGMYAFLSLEDFTRVLVELDGYRRESKNNPE